MELERWYAPTSARPVASRSCSNERLDQRFPKAKLSEFWQHTRIVKLLPASLDLMPASLIHCYRVISDRIVAHCSAE